MQLPKTQVWLLEASPRNPSTGAGVTVRLGGGGAHPYRYFGQQWLAGLDRPPIASSRLGYGEDDEAPGWGADSAAQAMQLVWAGGAARLAEIAGHYWRGAAFTLRRGPDGGADGEFAVRLTGKIRDAKIDTAGILAIDLADPTAALAVPVLPGVFAGSGGVEGPVDLKDRPKRRAFGDVRNVELWPLDSANNIWVATDPARPLQGIPAVYDRGNAGTVGATVAWAGSVAATLTALVASSPPAGGFCRAPSIGCIKWWHSSPGLLTADLQGEVGTGYVSTAPQIAERIVASRTAVTFAAGAVATWAAARAGTAGILLDNPAETVSQVLWRLLGPCTMWWHVAEDGKIALGEWAWGTSAGALSGGLVERRRTFRPTRKRILGYRRNHRQMARGDIAAALLIADIEGAQAAIDGAVGSTNSANLYRVEMAGYSKSIGPSGAASHLYGDSLVVAQYRVDLDEVGVGVGERISASLLWSLSQAGSATFRVGLYDAADTIVRTVIGPSVTTPVTNLRSVLEGVIRQAGEMYVRLFVRVDQAGGTLAMSMGMINRGPICAPYVAPTRGATYGSTWDQVTGAGKPEDGATRNAYQGVHNSANIYLKGDIVILGDGTKSYIAKQNVPASTLITNTAYWGLLVEGGGGAAGEAGYSAILSNQSHVVATASDGSGGDYSDAGGQMSIYEGATNRTGSATFAKVGAGSWYSINSAGVYTISDPGTDDATCQFDATYGSVTLRLTYSISKSKGGATAKAVKVTRTREVITYDGTGALAPSTQTTTFTAALQNSSATVNWSATDLAGNVITPVTNLLSAATGANVTMTAANFEARRGATNGVIVSATISDGGTHSDVVTVMKVQDGAAGAVGAGAYSLVQSTSNRLDLSVPGKVQLVSGGGGWNNSWRCAAPFQSGIRVEWTQPAAAQYMVSLGTSAALGESNPYTNWNYNFYVTSSGQIQRYLFGSSSDILGAVGTVQPGDRFALDYDGKVIRAYRNGTLIDTYAAIADDLLLYAAGTIYTMSNRIEALTIASAGRAGDAGAAGTPAPSIEVSRKAVGLWAYANGSVLSFADAAGLLKVRSGSTDVTAAASLSATPSSGVTGTINTAANTPVAGQPKGYYRVTEMTGDTGTLTLTAVSGGVTLTETFSIIKMKGGYEIGDTLPGTNLFEGRMFFLEADGDTDGELYRYTNGDWTVEIDGANLKAGSVTAAKLYVTMLSAITAVMGNLDIRPVAGAPGRLRVFDESDNPRLIIGDLD